MIGIETSACSKRSTYEIERIELVAYLYIALITIVFIVATTTVFGIFVGHDHDIDYIVADKGLALGYGRYSGDDTTYNNLRPGARILIVSEGKREFETYIREDDGRIVDHVRFKDGEISKVRK